MYETATELDGSAWDRARLLKPLKQTSNERAELLPTSVDASIVSQTVTVRYHPSLPDSTLSQALGDAGFAICSVVRDAEAGFNADDGTPSESALAEQDGWIDRAAEVWSRRYSLANKSERKRMTSHIERCDICRAKKVLSASTVGQGKSFAIKQNMQVGTANKPFVVVDATDSLKAVRVVMSIMGMTCDTCVGKISDALEMKPCVQSVHATLLTNSAVVAIRDKSHVADILQTIEDVGYEATVEQIDERPALQETGYESKTAPCERHILNLDWIKTVDINLLSNSATIIFEGRDQLPEIAGIIEDMGYEAALNEESETDRTLYRNQQRNISISVSGMYCDYCPPRIMGYLKHCAGEVVVDKMSSVADQS
ncbi:heavy-metal-associated domain-containing protein [Aspergillus puulaauensis]|uniref:HMA domain-containing protein n=1 Tax=Aspergillus puulaauensis TaxID=1220207 RepID=A0A7R7XA72_9EURO|nr:uncharacterized protein APUU_10520A [Aspergillus puulaauensis]BCS17692.1 hypothetical protein APUU_10520A [Aspergillus puulaauensis]